MIAMLLSQTKHPNYTYVQHGCQFEVYRQPDKIYGTVKKKMKVCIGHKMVSPQQ